MKTFKKKKLFKNATSFKITYTDAGTIREKEFCSTKTLEQFASRNSAKFDFLVIHKFALIDNEWYRYTVIGNRTLLLEELRRILFDLEDNTAYKNEYTKTSKSKK